MVNEKSLQNLKQNPFSATNQPEGTGRPKGAKNRKTIAAAWLSVKTESELPDGTKALLTQEDRIMISMINEAASGNVNAAAWVFDARYGKVANINVETKVHAAYDLTKLSDEDLEKMEEISRKARNDKYDDAEEVE